MLHPQTPALVLAPMEGVTDAPMRALMTERGGFTYCVSEFLRVIDSLYPTHVFHRHVPEFHNGCRTPSGTPVQIQLLGGDEEAMAFNAERAIRLGAQAIDINFGCPSPTVNRHDGGAALLKFPERICKIVASVRSAVPTPIPVSAKLRLGWDCNDDIHKNAEQAALGGASWITIHARTKVQGYAPPAHWKYIGEVRKNLDIPVIANGDIWSLEDFLRCQDVTGCSHFMIGRGALANPFLAWQIAGELKIWPHQLASEFEHTPANWLPILRRFEELSSPTSKASTYATSRIKQWIKMAKVKSSIPWFDDIKQIHDKNELFHALESHASLEERH